MEHTCGLSNDNLTRILTIDDDLLYGNRNSRHLTSTRKHCNVDRRCSIHVDKCKCRKSQMNKLGQKHIDDRCSTNKGSESSRYGWYLLFTKDIHVIFDHHGLLVFDQSSNFRSRKIARINSKSWRLIETKIFFIRNNDWSRRISHLYRWQQCIRRLIVRNRNIHRI